MWKVIDVHREVFPDHLTKAGDGSLCTFDVEELKSKVSISVELCCICSGASQGPHKQFVLCTGCRLSLMLGQSPDLVPRGTGCTLATIRGVLEQGLFGCSARESITITAESAKIDVCSNGDVAESPQQFTLTLRVVDVRNPAICSFPKASPTEPSSSDTTITAVWNPTLAVYWYTRAWRLKERGTWLIQKHLDKNKSTVLDQHDALCRPIWAGAFACYSRALQLSTLARWANETFARRAANPVAGDDDRPYELSNDQADSTRPVDLDRIEDMTTADPDVSSISAMQHLEFSLLLNLALCQLKVGSSESAAQNCSQALHLDPGWIEWATDHQTDSSDPTDGRPDGSAITSVEVAKALHRRAQAYTNRSRWDEAAADLKVAMRLQKLAGSQAGLSASETLLAHVRKQMVVDQNVLANRLRKHRQLF
ncbi:Tetratricopeptide repeat protein [Paragonimus heterotremus]|uniref:Tetratricopeptide repeat protein n=1 Tax=Paragonimus heterotremus TaxID=100268 RepID=A0A8J4SR56_9TREM|nr:Tetratricopeptide repeat protein [Paragonimus heterotremus]